jgi:addiction module HigA family antidote
MRTPIHPGQMLADELKERGLTIEEFAALTGIASDTLAGIIEGKMAITAPIADKLSAYLGTSARLWLNLQQTYEERQQFMILAEFGSKLANSTVPLDENIGRLIDDKFFEMYEKF